MKNAWIFFTILLLGFVTVSFAQPLSPGAVIRLNQGVSFPDKLAPNYFIQFGNILEQINNADPYCEFYLDPAFPFSTLNRRLDVPYIVLSVETMDSPAGPLSFVSSLKLYRTFYDPVLHVKVSVQLGLDCRTAEPLNRDSFNQIVQPILEAHRFSSR